MRTGQGALRETSKPFLRSFGPDLTGLFVHDGGAFGVKAQATLRLIRAPMTTDFASFAFQSFEDATSALCEIARADLAEEVYVLDPASTNDLKVSPAEARKAMTSIARHAGGPLRATKALYAALRHGTRLIPRHHYSLHLVAAGRSRAAVQADIQAARKIAIRRGGKPVASTIPRLARAQLFENLDGILGSDGRRWAALNAKVAHSDALDLVRSAENAIAPFKNDMTALGVSHTKLASALLNHCYSYEAVFHWQDALSPIHRAAVKPDVLEKYAHTAPNPEAWQLVKALRSEMVKVFQKKGAASNQIGRTYPFMTALTEPPADFLRQVKTYLDPQGLMNPGVLELS
jgi:FAD/FMN-containing dehydrogenase